MTPLGSDRVVEALQADDRQLLCCQTRFLYHHPETGELSAVDPCPTTYGAYCPFGHRAVWPDIAWNLREMRPGEPREDIAAVLGAGYAAQPALLGPGCVAWEGLRSYGSDEAYLSFKVWREGGRCVLLKDVVIGHVYRNAAPYVILGKESVYNQLLIARLLFPQSLYCRALVRALRQRGPTAVQALHDLSARRRSLGPAARLLPFHFHAPDGRRAVPPRRAPRHRHDRLRRRVRAVGPPARHLRPPDALCACGRRAL